MENAAEKSISPYQVGQVVSLYIDRQTDLGFVARVNEDVEGLLYADQVFQPLHRGDEITGYVQKIREDGKLDLSLYPLGRAKIDDSSEEILYQLSVRNGHLPLHDRSTPEQIYTILGVSKKSFKQAIGALYKARRIAIDDNGLRLL